MKKTKPVATDKIEFEYGDKSLVSRLNRIKSNFCNIHASIVWMVAFSKICSF